MFFLLPRETERKLTVICEVIFFSSLVNSGSDEKSKKQSKADVLNIGEFTGEEVEREDEKEGKKINGFLLL